MSSWTDFKGAVDIALSIGAVLRQTDEAGEMIWVLESDHFWIHGCTKKECVIEFAEFLGIEYEETDE